MEKELDVEYDQIFIIDCLPEEEREKYKISQDLMQFLADNGIKQETSICRNRPLFMATMKSLEKRAANGEKFALHIISHGDAKGLWIKSTDEDVLWTDLRNFLKEINSHMKGSLIVNMTSCLGLHGIKIVDENEAQLPFFGLIGYSKDLPVGIGKEFNREFYQKMLAGEDISQAVSEIKTTLSDDNFYCISALGYKAIKNTLNRYK